MLVDANILLYSVTSDSPYHAAARTWLEEALNGSRRVAIPWLSMWAFVRISTNPRAMSQPLASTEAWEIVEEWLSAPATWTPEPGRGHAEIMRGLLARHQVSGTLVTDAVLATLCIEHGLDIVSNDSDFARFDEITWINPVAPPPLRGKRSAT